MAHLWIPHNDTAWAAVLLEDAEAYVLESPRPRRLVRDSAEAFHASTISIQRTGCSEAGRAWTLMIGHFR